MSCNKQEKNHIVSSVLAGSAADSAGIKPGDLLISINDEPVVDIFDYRFNSLSAEVDLVLERDGKQFSLHVSKEESEDMGLDFENGLMDNYRSCHNKCIFCFIDQMPPGMRETLYFKDDDSRLSFLQGNYVTLTNMSDKDVDRIIKYKMEPINISFQTTNPELRCKMLNNRFAGNALKIADRFYEAGIVMNGQIVLCKGVNDKDELKRSIEDLSKYLPVLESVSVVPVGLSKYREGLFELEPFTKEDAIEVIDTIESYQKKFYEEYGLHFIHASDEWYITAGREVPEEERYDGYLQLENGVGMTRLMENEFDEAFDALNKSPIAKFFMKKYEATIVTGRLFFPYLKKFADKVMNEFPKIELDVVPIRNDFFGELITVSGLLTAQDIIKQLKERGYKKNVLLPRNVLKADEPIFLDDMTLDEFTKELNANISTTQNGGEGLLSSMLGKKVKER
ncbi:MAG: DUF512 domain-containing protein [Lachnospiraceae bacterium]|nr:DUF512 domain-containing protein [Lachnospiraceae bacterium]